MKVPLWTLYKINQRGQGSGKPNISKKLHSYKPSSSSLSSEYRGLPKIARNTKIFNLL